MPTGYLIYAYVICLVPKYRAMSWTPMIVHSGVKFAAGGPKFGQAKDQTGFLRYGAVFLEFRAKRWRKKLLRT